MQQTSTIHLTKQEVDLFLNAFDRIIEVHTDRPGQTTPHRYDTASRDAQRINKSLEFKSMLSQGAESGIALRLDLDAIANLRGALQFIRQANVLASDVISAKINAAVQKICAAAELLDVSAEDRAALSPA